MTPRCFTYLQPVAESCTSGVHFVVTSLIFGPKTFRRVAISKYYCYFTKKIHVGRTTAKEVTPEFVKILLSEDNADRHKHPYNVAATNTICDHKNSTERNIESAR